MKNLKRGVIGMSFLIVLCLSGCSIADRVEITVTDKSGNDVILNCPKVGVGDFILGGWCYVVAEQSTEENP